MVSVGVEVVDAWAAIQGQRCCEAITEGHEASRFRIELCTVWEYGDQRMVRVGSG